MKILFTHELYPPEFAGGGEYIVEGAARTLAAAGCSVRVLTTGRPALSERDGVVIRRLPVSRYRFNLAVRRIVKEARTADVIQTFNYHAALPSLAAGRILGKPVLLLLLGLFDRAWLEMRGPTIGRAYIAWEKMLVRRRFSRLVFLSEYSRQIGISLGAPEASLVNPYGLDLDYFRPAAEKRDTVLFAGKLDVRKGVYDLLEAARILPGIRFQILGWGPDEARMRQIASSNVEFLGFDRGERRRRAFSEALVYVLPSRAEGLPVALLEAMACGCAAVCTLPVDFAGSRVPAGDPAALAAALGSLMGDREATLRLGRTNRRKAETYTWERFGANLIAAYEEALGARGPRREGALYARS